MNYRVSRLAAGYYKEGILSKREARREEMVEQ
jgi:hypothetical protein